MRILTNICIFLFASWALAQDAGSIGFDNSKSGNIHIISIGINEYPETPLRLCVSDSEALIAKVKYDNSGQTGRVEEQPDVRDVLGKSVVVDSGRPAEYNIQDIFVHQLHDSQATIANIKQAFKTVISNSKSNDYFIFFFSGFTWENETGMTFLMPYDKTLDFRNFDEKKAMSMIELAKLMEQIPSEKQLVISEAGNGRIFAENLISQLFESNPLIAAGTKRNRVILTTKNLGIEGGRCPDGSPLQTGYLMHYILQTGNLLDVFHAIDKYEYDLVNAEVKCAWRNNKYVALYEESQYRNIVIKNFRSGNSRGSKSESIERSPSEVSAEGSTHAIVIATDTYDHKNAWGDLRNPRRDAEVVSKILESRFDATIHELHNLPKADLLTRILEIKNQLNEQDKLIVFIAGHGYYSTDYSDGYIVLKNSLPLQEDIVMNTYLQMATLHKLLDNMAPKNIFAVFDVCFGGTFDLNAPDVALSSYGDLALDISLDEFINRKSKNQSRLFLASGRYKVPDYWDNSLDHSPFADKLINVLKKEEEFISPGKIFAAMEGNATEPILKQFGSHETRGDFLIKVNE